VDEQETSEAPETFPALPDLPPPRARKSRVLALIVAVYGLSLLAVWGLLHFGGDRWWPATIMLFAPRWIYAFPWPVLAVFAAIKSPRLLWALAGLALVIWFPIMGFQLHWGSPASGPSALRVVSFNIEGMAVDQKRLMVFLDRVKPDVVVLQEYPHPGTPGDVDLPWPADWHVVHHDEYLLASRFPVVSWEPFHRPGARDFVGVAHTLDRNGQKLRVVNLHLMTPREGLEAALHFKTVMSPSRTGKLIEIILLRAAESRIVSAWAWRSDLPTIVAGDFNMPCDSTIFRRDWTGSSDAFSQSGFGFGSTKITVMHDWKYGARIDHVLFDSNWTARRCWVGPDLGSDHLPLVAELE